MFDKFPFLGGKYLSYSEYYTLKIALHFLLFWIISTLTSYLISLLYKKPGNRFSLLMTTFELNQREVLRALSIIIEISAWFWLIMTFATLSAFDIIPIYITCTCCIIITLLYFQDLRQKYWLENSTKQGTLNIQSALKKTSTIIIIYLSIIACITPIFLSQTCICGYEDYSEYVLPKWFGNPFSMNTQISRLYQVKQFCWDQDSLCHIYATLPEDTSTSVFINIHTHILQNKQLKFFDEFHFTTIYENHQHTHKRSKLLKYNQIDLHGTLYIGDGSWGAEVSDDELKVSDLIDNIQRVNSIWISEISNEGIKHVAITVDGSKVDEFNQ